MTGSGLTWTVFVRASQGVDTTTQATRDGATVWICCIAGTVKAPGAVARVVTSDPLAALAALGVERPVDFANGAPVPMPAPASNPKRGG